MPPALADLEVVFSGVISVALTGVGIAVLIMLVVGGFKYLLAGSDKEAAQKARNTLTYAIIGLVVVLASWMFIGFLGSFLGIDFSDFTLCLPGFHRSAAVGFGCVP